MSRRPIRRPLVLLVIWALGGCAPPPPSLDELNVSYLAALDRTAPLAASFAPGGPEEQRAIANLQAYFAGLTPAIVRDRTLDVYAPTAYLNDTLGGIEGAAHIRRYFGRSTERARVLEVKFLDQARTGTDYYIRWAMTIEANGLNGGKPVVSYGVTQFRFDKDGRVLIHKDFWDSGTGLYEQIPLLGRVLRWVRGAAEAE